MCFIIKFYLLHSRLRILRFELRVYRIRVLAYKHNPLINKADLLLGLLIGTSMEHLPSTLRLHFLDGILEEISSRPTLETNYDQMIELISTFILSILVAL